MYLFWNKKRQIRKPNQSLQQIVRQLTEQAQGKSIERVKKKQCPKAENKESD